MKILTYILLLLLLINSSIAGELEAPAANLSSNSPPIQYEESGIIISVISQGCTRKKDFLIMLNQSSELVIKRLKVDKCRAKPRRIKLFYGFDELGIQPVYLL